MHKKTASDGFIDREKQTFKGLAFLTNWIQSSIHIKDEEIGSCLNKVKDLFKGFHEK